MQNASKMSLSQNLWSTNSPCIPNNCPRQWSLANPQCVCLLSSASLFVSTSSWMQSLSVSLGLDNTDRASGSTAKTTCSTKLPGPCSCYRYTCEHSASCQAFLLNLSTGYIRLKKTPKNWDKHSRVKLHASRLLLWGRVVNHALCWA